MPDNGRCFFQQEYLATTRHQALTWKITDNVPRKRKDTEFDKLLQNRRYVSQRWLLVRQARGVVPPPVYKFENVNELFVELEKSIDVQKVVQKVIDSTREWLSTDWTPSVDYEGALNALHLLDRLFIFVGTC
jgi:hypothetical protein